MPRPRKPDSEKSTNIFVKVPNPVLDKIKLDGDPGKVILAIVLEKYKN